MSGQARKCKLYKLMGIPAIVGCQIILQDSEVFEMLNLAQELGVEELRAACEDHVTSTLSVLNACTFLAAAMDIQDRAVGKYHICKCFYLRVGVYAQFIKYFVPMYPVLTNQQTNYVAN
jgi:hypothetical protein